DGDGADAGPSPAVRDAEGLVQVEVRDVAPELARPREADERVEVRPVDVHLTTSLMYEVAHLAHVLLVDTVRRRVRDHDRRDARAVVGELRAQVVEVHLAALG